MALTRPSTLARVSSQPFVILPLLLLLLLLLLINIFFPFDRRVGVLLFTSRAAQQNDGTEGERRNAAERRVAGRVVSARVVPNGFGFGLARTVLRPSARPSRAVQRRPPEAQRSGTTGRSQPNGRSGRISYWLAGELLSPGKGWGKVYLESMLRRALRSCSESLRIRF